MPSSAAIALLLLLLALLLLNLLAELAQSQSHPVASAAARRGPRPSARAPPTIAPRAGPPAGASVLTQLVRKVRGNCPAPLPYPVSQHRRFARPMSVQMTATRDAGFWLKNLAPRPAPSPSVPGRLPKVLGEPCASNVSRSLRRKTRSDRVHLRFSKELSRSRAETQFRRRRSDLNRRMRVLQNLSPRPRTLGRV